MAGKKQDYQDYVFHCQAALHHLDQILSDELHNDVVGMADSSKKNVQNLLIMLDRKVQELP